MLIACIGVSAQTQTVTGTVTDANHEPMIGVSVMEKGSTNGTATDVDGKFSIKVGPKATLKVLYRICDQGDRRRQQDPARHCAG